MDHDENIANLPVILEPPTNNPAPPPQRGRRRVGLAARNPHPFPGREERHRRRQAKVDAQPQNNRDRDAALQQENQAAREENYSARTKPRGSRSSHGNFVCDLQQKCHRLFFSMRSFILHAMHHNSQKPK